MHNSLEEITATARHVETAQPPETPMPQEHAQETESTQQEVQEDRKSCFFFFLLEVHLPKTKTKQMFEFRCFSSNAAEWSIINCTQIKKCGLERSIV